jgi:DivIVA domain-containing protein
MDLTSQVLRQVEFGWELRGYKTSDVDDFLEKVALAVDELHEALRSARERLERAERLSTDRAGVDDEESIRRTLVLAQRTADLAVKEAQDEAAQLLDGARSDAETIVADARAVAERTKSDAEKKLRDEVARLGGERDRLRGEIDTLTGLLGAERERLTESLSTMLRFVEKNLSASPEAASSMARSLPAIPPEPTSAPIEPNVDELEAAIAEDAAAAAPSPRRPSEDGPEDDESASGRPSLKAVPQLDEAAGETKQGEATVAYDYSNKADTPAS